MLRLQGSCKRFITHRFVLRIFWFDSNCDHKSDFKKVGFELPPWILTFKTFDSNCKHKSFKIFKGFEWFWQIQWVRANLLYYKQVKSTLLDLTWIVTSNPRFQKVRFNLDDPQIWTCESNPYKKFNSTWLIRNLASLKNAQMINSCKKIENRSF